MATSSRPRAHPAARVRWDRLARVGMLVVLVMLLYLYVSAGASILATWHQARVRRGEVATMLRLDARLRAQRALLSQPATLVNEARRLGMIRPGEQPYLVEDLPPN